MSCELKKNLENLGNMEVAWLVSSKEILGNLGKFENTWFVSSKKILGAGRKLCNMTQNLGNHEGLLDVSHLDPFTLNPKTA